MKKLFPFLLICLVLLTGCVADSTIETSEPVGQVQLANPWKNYDTLADAESACGLTFPVSENIPEGFAVESYSVMNNSLLEVTYKKRETEITVRMLSAENQDISGVYENFTETKTFNQNDAAVTKKLADHCCVYLIHRNGYSFSIYASNLTADDACQNILSCIC